MAATTPMTGGTATRTNLDEQLKWLELNRDAAISHGFKQDVTPNQQRTAPPTALPPEAAAAGAKFRSMLTALSDSEPLRWAKAAGRTGEELFKPLPDLPT